MKIYFHYFLLTFFKNNYEKKKIFLKKILNLFLIVFLITIINIKNIKAENLDTGKKIFLQNCNVCHLNGNNLIIPEKTLTKQNLNINGLLNLNSIIYEITNGKNGMPGFINRLSENEIKEVANYILEK